MIDSGQLHEQGYALLRGAIPGDQLDALRRAFDASILPSAQWPVPRGFDWRHAMLDLDPGVQSVCRLPALLDVVGELIGDRYFLAQVEGREPVVGGGHQRLHRDLSEQRPGDIVNALAFLDDYDESNGGTRMTPGSHRPQAGTSQLQDVVESAALQLSGKGGDIFVFDADLLHASGLNRTGARRRSILISYRDESLYPSHVATAALRAVRMDCSERFEPRRPQRTR